MSTIMTLRHGSSLETRPSLLSRRLHYGEHQESWRDFYAIYGGLIRSFFAKAGLTPEEAEEAVQETVIGVSRLLPEFVSDSGSSYAFAMPAGSGGTQRFGADGVYPCRGQWPSCSC